MRTSSKVCCRVCSHISSKVNNTVKRFNSCLWESTPLFVRQLTLKVFKRNTNTTDVLVRVLRAVFGTCNVAVLLLFFRCQISTTNIITLDVVMRTLVSDAKFVSRNQRCVCNFLRSRLNATTNRSGSTQETKRTTNRRSGNRLDH